MHTLKTMRKPFVLLTAMMFFLLATSCLKTYTCNCETVVIENNGLNVISREEFRIKVEALNKADAENACSDSRSTIATANETSLTDCGLR